MGIVTYVVKLWSQEENREMEGVYRKHLKWILSLDACIPDHIVMKEMYTKKMRVMPGARTMKYEVKECIREKALEIREIFYRQNAYTVVHENAWTPGCPAKGLSGWFPARI